MRILLYLLPFFVFFVVLGVLLSFLSPWAPVLLLASLVLQVPIVYLIAKLGYDSAYAERLHQRTLLFEKEGNAELFLNKENAEAAGFGYRLLSRKNKTLNLLTRAELLSQLERDVEAEPLLAELEKATLGKEELVRFERIKECHNIKAHQEEKNHA